ncbi:unnamed protein product [Choristocarpus tenellus]
MVVLYSRPQSLKPLPSVATMSILEPLVVGGKRVRENDDMDVRRGAKGQVIEGEERDNSNCNVGSITASCTRQEAIPSCQELVHDRHCSPLESNNRLTERILGLAEPSRGTNTNTSLIKVEAESVAQASTSKNGVGGTPEEAPASTEIGVEVVNLATSVPNKTKGKVHGTSPGVDRCVEEVTSSLVEVKKCEVCGIHDRRYCCPRCRRLSCSLSCCLKHKKEEGCNGKRDRTKYIRVSSFTDIHLRSDLNFLEDALRCVDGGRRELVSRLGDAARNPAGRGRGFWRGRGRGRGRGRDRGWGRGSAGDRAVEDPEDNDGFVGWAQGGAVGLMLRNSPEWLSRRHKSLQRLVKEVELRGTKLLLMPKGMGRRESNTTTVTRPASDKVQGSNRWGRKGGRKGQKRRGGEARVAGRGRGEEESVNAGGGGEGEFLGKDKEDTRLGSGGGGDKGALGAINGLLEVRTDTVDGGVAKTVPHCKQAVGSEAEADAGARMGERCEVDLVQGAREREALVMSENKKPLDDHGEAQQLEDRVCKRLTRRDQEWKLSWRLEWSFVGAGAGAGQGTGVGSQVEGVGDSDTVILTDCNVGEDVPLHQILAEHFDPRPGNAPTRHRLGRFNKAWTVLKEGIKARQGDAGELGSGIGSGVGKEVSSCQLAPGEIASETVKGKGKGKAILLETVEGIKNQNEGLRLFMAQVPCPSHRPLYWELNPEDPLKIALKDKTVIEFPTVYVVLPEEARLYPTLVQDIITYPTFNLLAEEEPDEENNDEGEGADAEGDLEGVEDLEEDEEPEEGEMVLPL